MHNAADMDYLCSIIISDETYPDNSIGSIIKGDASRNRVSTRNLYCGTFDSQMGHSFICDGYDGNGLFHIRGDATKKGIYIRDGKLYYSE